MSGLFLVFIFGMWLTIVFGVIIYVTPKIVKPMWQFFFAIAIFFILIPLPLVDEIIGKWQFEKLCAENSTVHFDRETAIGRTVYLEKVIRENIDNDWMKLRSAQWRFVDEKNGELVLSYKVFSAERKWLRLSESGYPFTFSGVCQPQSPPSNIESFAEYGIKYVEPPKAN